MSVFTTTLSLSYLFMNGIQFMSSKNQYAYTICKPSLEEENSLSKSDYYTNEKQIKKESIY